MLGASGIGFFTEDNAAKWDFHIKTGTDLQRNLLIYPFINEILRLSIVTKSSCALDIGCGQGITTHYLSKDMNISKVIGIDPSLALVKIARDNYPHLDFHHCYAHNTVFKDDMFNFALCINVLFHMSPRLVFLTFKELKRIMRLHSKLVVTTIDPKGFLSFYSILSNVRSFCTYFKDYVSEAWFCDASVRGFGNTRLTLTDLTIYNHSQNFLSYALNTNGFNIDVEKPLYNSQLPHYFQAYCCSLANK